jgi:Integral membrane protein CcmA involved in cell shape determination
MFGKKRIEESFSVERFKTLIDSSTTIDGRMNFGNSVRIDGKVHGNLIIEPGCKGTIAIGPGAEVRGDINAYRVLVAGTVHGNIQATERVELLSSARVSGDIAYGSISISHGARVIGLLVEVSKSNDASETTDILIRTARTAGGSQSSA